MSDAIPLVVEKTDETNDKEDAQANPKTGQSNDMQSIISLLQRICGNIVKL